MCEIFHGPSGSKKRRSWGSRDGGGGGEDGLTLPIRKQVTACKVYLRVVGKAIEPQYSFPMILSELLKFNP